MAKLSDISLKETRQLGNGYKLRIENDDWGTFLRVVDADLNTIESLLVIDEEYLNIKIQVLTRKYQ